MAKETVRTFDEASMNALRRDHRQTAHLVQNLLAREQSRGGTLGVPFTLGKVDSTIAQGGNSGDVSEWIVDRDGDEVDANSASVTAYDWFGAGAFVGDKVELFRHAQSGRLYFKLASGTHKRKAVTDGLLSSGGSGTVSVWINGVDSTENVTAWLNWAEGGEDITAGKEIFIDWFPDEDDGNGRWVVTGAECE